MYLNPANKRYQPSSIRVPKRHLESRIPIEEDDEVDDDGLNEIE